MKVIIYLANLVFLFTSCNCQKSSTSSNLVENSNMETINSSVQNELPVIEYGANSRGYFFIMKVENKVLEYTLKTGYIPDRDFKKYENKIDISDKDWNEIVMYLKAVKLDEVKDYKWPTEMRYYDGAPEANIVFVKNGVKYPANGFDHLHPPVEIEKLVNKIISLIPQK